MCLFMYLLRKHFILSEFGRSVNGDIIIIINNNNNNNNGNGNNNNSRLF